MEKRFSIIVPVYKVEEDKLRACLYSIKKQKDTDIEVLVVDDGSPDKCGEICDEMARNDSRFRVIHTPNCGVSHARNLGIEKASGEYLIFVDGDDQLLPEAMSIIKSCPEMDLLLFDFYINGKKKKVHEKSIQFSRKEDLAQIQSSFIGGSNINGLSYTGAPWGKVYKKSIILKNDCYYNEHLPRSQDNEFNFRYMNYVSNCLYTQKAIYNYTVNDTSAMRKYWKKAYENSNILLNTIANEIDAAIDSQLCRASFCDFVFSKLRDVIDTNIYHEDNLLSNRERRAKLREVCGTKYFSACICEKKVEGMSFDNLLLLLFKMHWYFGAALLINIRKIIKRL